MKQVILIGLIAASVATIAGCASKTTRNSDGGIEGSVTRVWSDGMNLDAGGNSVRIDTWAVCGDATPQHINVGDSVTVFASRDLFSYDAWRILDANGQPACRAGRTSAQQPEQSEANAQQPAQPTQDQSQVQQEAPRVPRTTDGGIEGTVTRVWSDGMSLEVEGGGRMANIDTWAVCGDATPQHIKVGDRVTVFASRERFEYDAWRILNSSGQPACPRGLSRLRDN